MKRAKRVHWTHTAEGKAKLAARKGIKAAHIAAVAPDTDRFVTRIIILRNGQEVKRFEKPTTVEDVMALLKNVFPPVWG